MESFQTARMGPDLRELKEMLKHFTQQDTTAMQIIFSSEPSDYQKFPHLTKKSCLSKLHSRHLYQDCNSGSINVQARQDLVQQQHQVYLVVPSLIVTIQRSGLCLIPLCRIVRVVRCRLCILIHYALCLWDVDSACWYQKQIQAFKTKCLKKCFESLTWTTR